LEKKLFQRLVTRQSAKALLGSLILVTAITGCSSLPEPITGLGNRHYGYALEDPCIRCGESWVILPNQDMAALKHPSNQKSKEYYEAKLEEMYGPNWRELTPNWDK
jgi:hypothetical protein